MATSKSNTWRWVGVFILLVILFLLWLNGRGPEYAQLSAGCCGHQSEIQSEILDTTESKIPPSDQTTIVESVPDVELQLIPEQLNQENLIQEQAIQEPRIAEIACSADMTVAVEFDKGSASVSDVGKQQLDMVAKCISEKTQVVGFTDNSGSDKLNLKLSVLRAQAVVDYMVSQAPNMADLLTATGRGAENPIADNNTEQGRRKNRRIEFVKQ